MRLERSRQLDQRSGAGAIVERPVVNAIAVDGLADADVIDVSRQRYIFFFQLRITAGQLSNNVSGFDAAGLQSSARFQ